MHKFFLALVISIGSIFLTSCGAESPPPPSTEGRAITAEDEAQRHKDLEALALSNGIVSPPETPVVRWVPKHEIVEVLADCLAEEGFSVEVSGNGFEVSLDAEQEGAYKLASYVCEAQYPRVPGPSGPPPVEYIQGLYDYYAGDLTACLEKKGYEVLNTPTRETFTDTFLDASQWSPFRTLFEANAVASSDVEALLEACPEYPTDGRLDSFE